MNIDRRHYADLAGFVLIFSLLVLAYSPLLLIPFVFNDDFLIFSNQVNRCAGHPQFYYFFLIGRPLVPLLDCPVWLLIQNVNDLVFARLINIFVLTVSAFIFFKWLCKNNFQALQAILITIIIFVSPTFQTQVVLANSFCHMVAFVLSILCGIQVCNWLEDGRNYRIITASILLFLALSVHPCVAMFVWPVIFIFALNHKTDRNQLFNILAWFFILCIFYFIFVKSMNTIVPAFFHVSSDIVSGHEVALASNIDHFWHKFDSLLKAALRLWSVLPQANISVGVSALFFLAVVLKIAQLNQNQWRENLIRYIFLVLTVPLSLTPILAAQFDALSFRMISGLTAIIVIMLFVSLRKVVSVLPLHRFKNLILNLILILLVTIYIYHARSNITSYLALPAHMELEYIKDKLYNADIEQIDIIHIIRPKNPNWLHQSPVGSDEFGLLSSSISHNVSGLIRCAMIDLNFDNEFIDRVNMVSSGFYEKRSIPKHENTLIINMN